MEEELVAVNDGAPRHGWEVEWNPEQLLLHVSMRSALDGELYRLEALLSDYRAIPPLFEFVHPEIAERGTHRCYPKGGRGYFHNKPCICAPWNRGAYAAHGGPHGDWAMASWASYRPNHSRLGDMLVLIQLLLDDSASYQGRMA